MPHNGILRATEEAEADILGISTTMLFNLQSATQLISESRSRVSDVKISFGGSAFRYALDYWKEAGADAYVSKLRSAREIARSWSVQ
jgi:methanogenic corrinoid protein MtbC1